MSLEVDGKRQLGWRGGEEEKRDKDLLGGQGMFKRARSVIAIDWRHLWEWLEIWDKKFPGVYRGEPS